MDIIPHNMKHNGKSLRPFIGAKNYETSRNFYRDLGFEEHIIEPKMSVFISENLAFYLQDYYQKDWVDNTMVFMEVDDVNRFYEQLTQLNLPEKYERVKVTPIRHNDWGSECFVHDPSGIFWHFGTFKNK